MARKTAAQRQAVLAVLLLVSVAMLTWYYREPVGGLLHSTQRGGLVVISPLESGTSRLFEPLLDAYHWATGIFSAQSENAQLRQEVDQLRNQVISQKEAESENQRLRQMLGFVNQPFYPRDYKTVPARVIGRSASSWNATITINRGSGDGISMGQTVVSGQGLVGQVSAVAANSAQVLMIIDHNSHVEAKLQTDQAAGAMGTVIGSINGELDMDFVDKNEKVSKNDVVVTSGSGKLFVKGIPIGVVDQVSDQEIDYFKRISVTSFVDFNRLEEVMVLIPPPGTDQPPQVNAGG